MLGSRLYERNVVPTEAGSRRLVYELSTRIPKLPERLINVSDNKREVVHGLPSPLQEPPDRRIEARCREQLDPPWTEPQVRGLNPLVVEVLAQLELRSVEPFVRVDRLVEISDCKCDVVNTEYVHEHPILDGGSMVAPTARGFSSARRSPRFALLGEQLGPRSASAHS